MKEVIGKVLKEYKKAIVSIEDMDYGQSMMYLMRKSLDMGSCWYVSMKFPDLIYRKYYYLASREEFAYKIYWFQVPMNCTTKEEIVQSLTLRIERLTQMYERSN